MATDEPTRDDAPQDEPHVDFRTFKDNRPRRRETIMIINGSLKTFVRGRDEIEASSDEAVRAIYDEIWEYLAQVSEMKLEDADVQEGLDRIRSSDFDFSLGQEKERFVFLVFNALPTIYLNPAISGDPQRDLARTIDIVREIGRHDYDFWNRVATMIF